MNKKTSLTLVALVFAASYFAPSAKSINSIEALKDHPKNQQSRPSVRNQDNSETGVDGRLALDARWIGDWLGRLDGIESGPSDLAQLYLLSRAGTRSTVLTNDISTVSSTREGFTCPVVSIGSASGVPGSLVDIPINTSTLTGMGVISFDFTIDYDPSVLELREFDSTTGIAQSFSFTVNTNVQGKVSVAGYGTSGLVGSGKLFSVKFRVIGSRGASSSLSFSKILLNEGNPCANSVAGFVSVPRGNVSGTVRYFSGQNPVAVTDVIMSATGSTDISSSTNSSGSFTISGFGPGAYTLTPSKVSAGRNEAISALDSSLAAQASVGLISLSPLQRIAADVTGDGDVSALDSSRIAQYSVGLTLPSNDQTGKWKFSPPSISYESITEDLAGQDFIGILVGDITGDWFPPASLADQSGSGAVGQEISARSSVVGSQSPVVSGQSDLVTAIGFGLSSFESNKPRIRSLWTDFAGRKGLESEILEVPISIADAMSILAYDAVITYDPDVLEPVIDRPIESNGTLSTNFNVVANRSERGKLRLAAYGIAPVTGSGDLLVLRFRVKKPGANIEDANLRFESLMINEKSVISRTVGR